MMPQLLRVSWKGTSQTKWNSLANVLYAQRGKGPKFAAQIAIKSLQFPSVYLLASKFGIQSSLWPKGEEELQTNIHHVADCHFVFSKLIVNVPYNCVLQLTLA